MTRPISAVRAGGRLYVQSPIEGYTQAEMIYEARQRLAHNRQRQRLKNLLHTAADGGPLVNTRDLRLACQMAKMDAHSQDAERFGAKFDSCGTPRAVDWKGFHKSLPYPELYGANNFAGVQMPETRAQKKQREEYEEFKRQQLLAQGTAEQKALAAKPKASDEEVSYHFKILKRLMETRFTELRRAFRLIDEDSSGDCDRDELKGMLNAMFNLSIPENVLDRIIDLADYDGDGSINFAEFARLATTDDVLDMKKTLQADLGAWGTRDEEEEKLKIDYAALAAANRQMAAGGAGADQGQGYHPKLRRTGPGLDALRRAHADLKKCIKKKFSSLEDAFNSLDYDNSGVLRRAEIRRFLSRLSKTVPDRVISGLIDFCDSDGDAKTLNKTEFLKLMSADYLGVGGFDPAMSPRR
jgi:Ca2+-binding EF-hand superfamily protein